MYTAPSIRALIGPRSRITICLAAALAAGACEGSSSTVPGLPPDSFILSAAQKKSLDSTGGVIKQANPGNATLQSLVDSTLQVLAAGVEARRLNVTTNLTTKTLYFVGIHRAVSRSTGSFSTWTLVGFDDPSHLTVLVEVAGFAQNQTATPPTSVSGTIGDGTGKVNGLMLDVGSGGSVVMFTASSGTASFVSGAPGAACPGFTPTSIVTCAIETMTVRFTMTAGTRNASQPSDAGAPGMRLFFTPP
jgi:hypothetical protein